MTFNYDPRIAVVGMACRLPGGVQNTAGFKELIENGTQTWSDVPEDRFDWKSYYRRNSTSNFDASTNHRGGHFLNSNIKSFDAAFFGISPQEARAMDPQQRLLLEVAYEAFENAGVSAEKLRGSNTAVYIAAFNDDYRFLSHESLAELPTYAGVGTGDAILSNRISYQFDLKGPSFTLNTGCSGSLVALHAAFSALKNGEADMALVGGANLMLIPDTSVWMSRLGMLNDDGRSYTFDSRGSGYGRGEGIGAVVLKRSKDAQLENFPINAIIRNVAVGQDGRTNGITLPSADAQESLIRKTYLQASLDPRDTGYVEAHGTGTVAGDVAELSALDRVFGRSDAPITVGSVKANIGHLESASGVIGLIKAVLVLQSGQIPPVAGLETLKPELIPLTRRIQVPKRSQKWPNGRLLRASVNSFGYGGTNAHAILEHPGVSYFSQRKESYASVDSVSQVPSSVSDVWDYQSGSWPMSRVASSISSSWSIPSGSKIDERSLSQKWHLFTVSAASEKSLINNIKDLHRYASDNAAESSVWKLRQLSHTLNDRRSHLEWRTSIVSDSWASLLENTKTPTSSQRLDRKLPEVTLLFTGQGSQYQKMGFELYQASSIFRSSMEKSQSYLLGFGADWSLLDILYGECKEKTCNAAQISQPAVTAVQIALMDLISYYGFKFSTVVGHSSGEIAAAYAAGILTQSDALCIAYHRGRLATQVDQRAAGVKSTMMAVSLEEDRVREIIDDVPDASIACVNSPTSITLSGSIQAIDEIASRLQRKTPKILHKRLTVDVAYHSSFMQLVAKDYEESLKNIRHFTPTRGVRFISSVTTKEESNLSNSYWVRNLVETVRFKQSIEYILTNIQKWEPGCRGRMFIEAGPHQVLCPLAQQTSENWLRANTEDVAKSIQLLDFTSALTRGKDACQAFLQCLGNLWKAGLLKGTPDSNMAYMEVTQPLNDLPSYHWDHQQQYWLETRLIKRHLFPKHGSHYLLGQLLPTSTDFRPVWRNHIDVTSVPWVKDHVIDGIIIYPAAGYICTAMEAYSRNFQRKPNRFHFRDLRFVKPLVLLEEGPPVEIQFTMEKVEHAPTSNDSWRRFTVNSCVDGSSFIENSTGLICGEYDSLSEKPRDEIEELKAYASIEDQLLGNFGFRTINRASLYADFKEGGNAYGPSFQGIDRLLLRKDSASGQFCYPRLLNTSNMDSYFSLCFHPGTLDSCMQACYALSFAGLEKSSFVVTGIKQLSLANSFFNSSAAELKFLASKTKKWGASASCRASLIGEDQSLLVNARDVVIERLPAVGGDGGLAPCSYSMTWQPDYTFSHGSTQPSTSLCNQDFDDCAMQERDIILNRIKNAIPLALESVDYETVSRPELKLFYRWMKQTSTKLRLTEKSNLTIAPLGDFKVFGAEAEMLDTIIRNLNPILLGQQDALEVMVQSGALKNIYSSQTFQPTYRRLRDTLRQIAFKDGRLNILEIGAGSGSMLKALFEDLSAEEARSFVKNYLFTDVSSSFFGQAQTDFGHLDINIDFKEFDINDSPAQQGLQYDSYNVVIASNALHLASSPEKSLASCFDLLKSGGHIVLIESAKDSLFADFTLGTLPAWWSDDAQTPLLSLQTWVDTLGRVGFHFSTNMSSTSSGMCDIELMIARKKSSTPMQSCVPDSVSLLSSPALDNTVLCDLRISLSRILNTTLLQEIPSEISSDQFYVLFDTHVNPLLLNATPEQHTKITNLLLKAQKLVWITTSMSTSVRSAMENGIVYGLAKSVRIENPDLKLITAHVIDVECENSGFVLNGLNHILQSAFQSIQEGGSVEDEYVIKSGQVLVPRLQPDEAVHSALCGAPFDAKTKSGNISKGFQYNTKYSTDNEPVFDSEPTAIIPPKTLKISMERWLTKPVHRSTRQATGGSPIEILAGTGRIVGLNLDSEVNHDLRSGDNVFVWGDLNVSNSVFAPLDRVVKCPTTSNISNQASNLSLYGSLYHSLKHKCRLQPQDNILIHSGSRGVVSAVLSVVNLFQSKSLLLMNGSDSDDYTSLLDKERIVNGSSNLLYDALIHRTGQAGLQAVLTTDIKQLPGDVLSLLSESGGTLLHVSCADDIHLTKFPDLPPGVAFTTIRVDQTLKAPPLGFSSTIRELTSLLDNKSLLIHPLFPTLEVEDVGESLKSLSSSTVSDKDNGFSALCELSLSNSTTVKTLVTDPRNILYAEATYIIIGGLGGLGLEICSFMISQGAGCILLLTRRGLSQKENDEILRQFDTSLCKVRIVQCNPAKREHMVSLIEDILPSVPPLRGIIQAAAQFQDGLLENISPGKWRSGLESKVEATTMLIESLKGIVTLDFFLLLSSVAGVLGGSGQSNYAAGNAFLDNIANFVNDPNMNLISLNLGMVSDSGVVARNSQYEKNLRYQGYIPLKTQNILDLIHYTLYNTVNRINAKQAVIGFTKTSLASGGNHRQLATPLFRHINIIENTNKKSVVEDNIQDHKKRPEDAKNHLEASIHLQRLISERISEMVFNDPDTLNSIVPLLEIGFDSLMTAGLRTWITATFGVQSIKADTILKSSISNLSDLIISSSSVFAHLLPIKEKQDDTLPKYKDSTAPVNTTRIAKSSSVEEKSVYETSTLSQQPVPDIQQTMSKWLKILARFTDPISFQEIEAEAQKFIEPGQPGYSAYQQLLNRKSDPKIDCWLSDLYIRNMSLKGRGPLVPFNSYFAYHSDSPGSSQARRAAIVVNAALQWKESFEDGTYEVGVLAGKAQTSALLHQIAHTSTIPGADEDEMVTYPSVESIVVLHKGMAFKLKYSGRGVPRQVAFETAFEQIIRDQSQRDRNESWPGLLIADWRGKWAQSYKTLRRFSEENDRSIDAIEQAAFVICLDEESFTSSDDRMRHFLWGAQYNRWSEKSVQFIVTADSYSATLYHQGAANGSTATPVMKAIQRAIQREEASQRPSMSSENYAMRHFDVLPLDITVSPPIHKHIDEVKLTLRDRITRFSSETLDAGLITGAWLTSRRLHQRCSVNLITQMANRKFWGHDPSANETVAMSHFEAGHVDRHQLVTPESIALCNMIASSQQQRESSVSSSVKQGSFEDLRVLFKKAIKAQNLNIAEVIAGEGPIISIQALKWVLEDQGISVDFMNTPAAKSLLASPVFMAPWGENAPSSHVGTVCALPGSLFIYYAIRQDGISFDLWGHDLDVLRYKQCLQESLQQVHDLFVGSN